MHHLAVKEIDMLAYAAHRRRVAAPRSAPHAMLGIMVAHIAVIALVMSAKMDFPRHIFEKPIIVDSIPLPKPPPERTRTENPPKSSQSSIDQPPAITPVPLPNSDMLDSKPTPIIAGGDLIGPKFDPLPPPTPAPLRVGPRFITPAGLVRPPYPLEKLKGEEEAVLKLRLGIDEGGRVISVEPVGKADRTFLLAARRHILARWQYKPATEDGRPMTSSTVITLKFQLNA